MGLVTCRLPRLPTDSAEEPHIFAPYMNVFQRNPIPAQPISAGIISSLGLQAGTLRIFEIRLLTLH